MHLRSERIADRWPVYVGVVTSNSCKQIVYDKHTIAGRCSAKFNSDRVSNIGDLLTDLSSIAYVIVNEDNQLDKY